MTKMTSVALLFDVSAVLAGKTADWQTFSQMGMCYLPEPALAEIQFLSERASEPAVESTAREFLRFQPTSDWQVSTAKMEHPQLSVAAGQAVSKQARLTLAVAQAAVGLATEHPDSLVVLVANSQPLLKQVEQLAIPHLCGITLAAFKQWLREGQQPPVVVQKRQQAVLGGSVRRSAQSPGSTAAARYPSSKPRAHPLGPVIGTVISLGLLLVVGLGAWRFVQPNSFAKFWQKTGLPALPGVTSR